MFILKYRKHKGIFAGLKIKNENDNRNEKSDQTYRVTCGGAAKSLPKTSLHKARNSKDGYFSRSDSSARGDENIFNHIIVMMSVLEESGFNVVKTPYVE